MANMLESVRLKRNEVKPSGRLKAFYAALNDFAEAVSDFELVAIDDTIFVEGREITGRSSVTVGKVVKLLVILTPKLWSFGSPTRTPLALV